jgi:hypothetical protein
MMNAVLVERWDNDHLVESYQFPKLLGHMKEHDYFSAVLDLSEENQCQQTHYGASLCNRRDSKHSPMCNHGGGRLDRRGFSASADWPCV